MKLTLDRESPVPLYAQIEDHIRHQIAAGAWRPGNRIPSEYSLHQTYGVSRMTVRGVLNSLVGDGLLYRVPGKGTFVSEEKIRARSPAYQGIREQLEQMGIAISTELVRTRTTVPPESVRRTLRIGANTPVVEILRRRLVKHGPVSLHHSFIPVELAPTLEEDDVVSEQLCVVLETRYGLRAGRTSEHLEAVAATESEAALLDLDKGAPLLMLEDVIADHAGAVFEYSKILFRGDRLKLHFEHEADRD